MRRYSSKNRKGFTLGEMLITVAIVAILSAVAIISVTSYLWNVRLLDADQAAKEIYLAAQYHLSLASERGTLDQYTGKNLGTVDTLYKDSAYVNKNGGTLYDLVYSPGKDAADVINVILPQGSVDETMRTGGSYIITYDKDTATVVGVFYSYAGRSYGYSFTADTLTNETTALQSAMTNKDSEDSKAVRKHFPDKKNRQTIGFYGGKDLAAGKTDAPVLSIENNDTLSAIVTLSSDQYDHIFGDKKDKDDMSDYEILLTIKGNTSGNTFTKVVEKSSLKKSVGDNPIYQYSTVLDAWQSHAYVNSNDKYDSLQIDWQFYDKQNNKYLIPGENITVTASIVKKEKDGSYSSVSKPSNSVTANSMFGSLKTVNGEYTVTISSIRHLENLWKIDASKLNIVNAVQVTDISFTQYQNNMAATFGGDPNLYIYMPVNLYNNLNYDGGYEYTDSNGQKSHRQHMISDLAVGANTSISDQISKEGGIFGSLYSGKTLKISNLQIIDIDTNSTGSEYGGALLGDAMDKTTVSTDNVLVWDKSAAIGINADSDAGGLIGHSEGTVNITNTAVSAYVKSTKGNAGGLIGSASVLTVKDSYVSGHTYQKDYVLETESVTDKDNQHYNIIAKNNAGGIAGTVTTLNGVKDSYVTASVYGDTAHAFVGSVSDDSAITGAGSYAITTVNGDGVKEPSDFSGKAATTTKYVNDESLLDGNEEVPYPYTVIHSLDSSADAWFLRSHVGDWKNAVQPSVNFNNDEILQFKTTIPNVGTSDTVEVQIFYNGTFGQTVDNSALAKTFIFKDGKITVKNWNGNTSEFEWLSDLCKFENDGGAANITINLDDITYYKNGHLGDFFNVICQDLSNGYSPGYDVTARVLVNGKQFLEPVTTNSSFGTGTNAETAVISCGRHLQNMSSKVPHRYRLTWKNAELTQDIYWNTEGNTFFDRVKKLRINQDDEVTSVYLETTKSEVTDQKFYPIACNMMFSGSDSSFHGKGHTIYDISFDTRDGKVGLFSYTEGLNSISDLTIENGVIDTSDGIEDAGILAGHVVNTSISNCRAIKALVNTGIYGDGRNGGLIGYLEGGSVLNSSSSGSVTGKYAGGLIGSFQKGTDVSTCQTSGSVSGSEKAGGLIGSFSGRNVTDSSSISTVTGGNISGGLIGNFAGNTVSGCLASGDVLASDKAGGLIGQVQPGSVENSSASGTVRINSGGSGSSGGLVGSFSGTNVTSCSSTSTVTGGKNAGGLIGEFSGNNIKNSTAAGSVSGYTKYSDSSAGGLIGFFSGQNVIYSGASSYVTGANAGGLIGILQSGTVSECFSGGRTTNGSYLADANRKGSYNVEGDRTAGGLIGILQVGTVSDSFSTSSVLGGSKNSSNRNKWSYTNDSQRIIGVGGLIGSVPYNNDPNGITNCYAIGMVQGPKKKTGALIGNQNSWQRNLLTKNYYLEGINYNQNTLEELPAIGGGLFNDESDNRMFKALNYYDDYSEIAKDSDVTTNTQTFDSTLSGQEYPFKTYSTLASDSTVKFYMGDWQIPDNKNQSSPAKSAPISNSLMQSAAPGTASAAVSWQYKVKYVLSLPDVVYEAKSDTEKAEAVKNGTDVKPVEIEMYETTVTSDNPYVFDAVKADDSKPASLDGLKLTNGDTAQNVGYHNGDQTVTYVYTPDFDKTSIVKDHDLGVYEMELSSNSDDLKKVLSALKPYLADQTPDSDDDTISSDASAYEKYLGTKNSDYRLVYEMTYTLQNSDGSMGSSSVVVYQAGEDGTVKDKDGKAAVLSGSVPTVPGTYVVSGRIVLQHRSDILDEKGNKTGDKWSDANIVYASSDSKNVSAVIGK